MTESKNSMEAKKAIEVARDQLSQVINRQVNHATSIKKEKTNWLIRFEVVEKKSIPDAQDILGIYEVAIDDGDGKLVNFERKGMRRRGDTAEISEV